MVEEDARWWRGVGCLCQGQALWKKARQLSNRAFALLSAPC